MKNLRIIFLFLFTSLIFANSALGRSKRIEPSFKDFLSKKIPAQPMGLIGKPSLPSLGGPNSYGYTWLDSDAAGGPTYNWIEISSIGTKVQNSEWKSPEDWPRDDGTAGPYYLGFQFLYNGNAYDSIYIGTNGILSFTDTNLTRDGYFYYGWIPYLRYKDALALFYNDLNLDPAYLGGGEVYYWTNSADSFIVQYKNVKPYVSVYTTDTLNFEVILVETDSSITYQYKTVATPNSILEETPFRADSTALIGIQDHTRNFGLRYFAFGREGYENVPEASLAIKFKRTSDFVHNVVPRREIIYYATDDPYYYPPHHLFYTEEVGDTLTENSVTVFNTGPNQEDNIPVVCKIFKKDNEGGYSLEDSFYNTISSISAGDTATVAFSDSWTPDTRGSYLVTYYTALTTDDLPCDDTTSGYLFAEKNELFSPWKNTVPNCNGIIESDEWSDAATLDISKFAVPQITLGELVVVGPHFYESGAAILYVKNDSSNLYFALDLPGDTSSTMEDWISIDIDDDGDKFFDLDFSEGAYVIFNEYRGNTDTLIFLPQMSVTTDSVRFGAAGAITGWQFGIQSNGEHQQAEIRIPFGSSPKWYLNSAPGRTINIWIGAADEADPYTYGEDTLGNQTAYWPWQGIFSYNTQKLAKIRLSTSQTWVQGDESEKFIADDFGLHQNYPNPFNPTTIINYELPYPAKIEINIYNILGQKIKKLLDGFKVKGSHSVVWDGKDQKGKEVSSGIYFYKIVAGDYSCVRKMILLR